MKNLTLLCLIILVSGCAFEKDTNIPVAPTSNDLLKTSLVRYQSQIFELSSVSTQEFTFAIVFNQITGKFDTLKADLYFVPNDPEPQKWTVVFEHGGGFLIGTKAWSSATLTKLAAYGYAVFSIDYRLVDMANQWTVGPFYAGIDMRSAISYIRSDYVNFQIDTTRIVAWGESAGGIASMIATYDAPLDSTAILVPGYSGQPDLCAEASGALILFGNDYLYILDGESIPMLMSHCELDATIPFAWAKQTFDYAVAQGIPATRLFFNGGDPECHTHIGRIPYIPRLTGWLYQQLQ